MESQLKFIRMSIYYTKIEFAVPYRKNSIIIETSSSDECYYSTRFKIFRSVFFPTKTIL